MSSVSPEQFLALSEEIAALAKAGLPLERGLGTLARELPRSLRKLTEEMSVRLQRGEPITAIMESAKLERESAWGAIIAAALRCEKPAEVIGRAAAASRRDLETRRLFWIELIPAATSLVIGYAVFVGSLILYGGKMAQTAEDLGLKHRIFSAIAYLYEHVAVWSPWPIPIMIAATIAYCCIASRFPRLGWPNPLRELRRSAATAALADLTALLLEHGTPLPESIRLAANACGDRETAAAANEIAIQAQRGETPHIDSRALSPAFVWLLTQGGERLPERLRHEAERARRQSQRLRFYAVRVFPAAIGLLFGLLAAGAIAVLVMWPTLEFYSFFGELKP